MRKLRLDVEELEVESFGTDAGDGQRRGTVEGREDPVDGGRVRLHRVQLPRRHLRPRRALRVHPRIRLELRHLVPVLPGHQPLLATPAAVSAPSAEAAAVATGPPRGCGGRMPKPCSTREATMRKLKLAIDRLAVESFPTVPEPALETGTVLAAEATARTNQCGTCYTSCAGAIGYPQCTCPIHVTG